MLTCGWLRYMACFIQRFGNIKEMDNNRLASLAEKWLESVPMFLRVMKGLKKKQLRILSLGVSGMGRRTRIWWMLSYCFRLKYLGRLGKMSDYGWKRRRSGSRIFRKLLLALFRIVIKRNSKCFPCILNCTPMKTWLLWKWRRKAGDPAKKILSSARKLSVWIIILAKIKSLGYSTATAVITYLYYAKASCQFFFKRTWRFTERGGRMNRRL